MEYSIYACEKSFLLSYLSKISNLPKDIDLKAYESTNGDRASSQVMEFNGDTAYIKIMGLLKNSPQSFLEWLYDIQITEYSKITEAIQEAERHGDIKKIVLQMNTPGGFVDGVDPTSFAIKNCSKEIIAENHGLIASAGYWLAASADKIVAKAQTNETGSIGVIVIGYDIKEARKNAGYKLVKVISMNAPDKHADLESAKGIKIIQARVDAIERVFIERVAQGRKTDIETVKKDFGKGNILMALDPDGKSPDALNSGMIDSVDVGGQIIVKDTSKTQSIENNSKKGIDDKVEINQNEDVNNFKEDNMKLAEYLEKHPEAKTEIEKMVSASVEVQVKASTDKKAESDGEDKKAADIEKAKAYISGDYPKAIQDLAVEVISGKQSLVSLEAAASAIDANKEAGKIGAAAKETEIAGETITEPEKKLSENGEVKSEEDFEASIDRVKKAQGRK